MKNRVRLMGLAALVLVISTLLSAGPAFAQTSPADEGIAGKSYYNVNIRTAPGTNRPIIGTIPAGSEFVAIGRDESNSWVQVEIEGTTGWSAAWLFVFEADTIDLRVTTDVEAPPASGPGPFDMLVPFTMNLRAGPTTFAPVLNELPYLSRVDAIARDETNSWIMVEYEGDEGWLALWLVVLLGDVNELPLEGGTTTTVATVPTTSASTSSTGITVTAPHTTNMRVAPDSDASVVAELPYGIKGNAIGRNAGSNWILVEYDGDEGWVARWSVWVSDNYAGLPIEDDSDEPIPTLEDVISVQAVFDLTVRANPGGNQYAPVGQISAGETVEPLARTADSQWLLVNVDGTEGWIAGWPVLPNADLNLLPIEEPIL